MTIRATPAPFPRVGLLLLLVACLSVLLPASVKAQNSQPSDNSYTVVFSVYDFVNNSTWPIALKDIQVGGKHIPMGTPVHLEGNWLPKLQVVVQNVSLKRIAYAFLLFYFPKAGVDNSENPRHVYGLAVGQLPDAARIGYNGAPIIVPPPFDALPPLNVAPGDQFTFDFARSARGDANKVAIASGPITNVQIYFQRIYFDDGSKWDSETYYAPSGQPGQYIKQSPDAFLGSQ